MFVPIWVIVSVVVLLVVLAGFGLLAWGLAKTAAGMFVGLSKWRF